MKLFFSLFLFSAVSSTLSMQAFAEPCNVELYSKIYRLDHQSPLAISDAVKSSDCKPEINSQIINSLNENSGEVSIHQIEKRIGDENIHITPRKIISSFLDSFLQNQLAPNSNLVFQEIKSLSGNRTFSLVEGESIQVFCDSCQSHGNKNIKIEIANNLTNQTKASWLTSKIFIKTKVFKAKHALSFQQKRLSPDDFYSDEVLIAMPENLLGTIENIHFYHPNKTILQGSIINNLDLQPVDLVSYGVPVKAILKNQNIALTKIATPNRSAQYGDTVELKIGENKIISGKVIDYNQVVIEL